MPLQQDLYSGQNLSSHVLLETVSQIVALEFKSLVSEQDYKQLMDFMYINSEEKLDDFSEFVHGQGVKKNPGYIYNIVYFLLPPMSAEDWDKTPSTTNTEIKAAKEAWKQSAAQLKTLWAELKSVKESSSKTRKLLKATLHTVIASASSSGCVKTRTISSNASTWNLTPTSINSPPPPMASLPGRDNQSAPTELQIEEYVPVPPLMFDIIPNFTTASLSFPAIPSSMPDTYFTPTTSLYFSASNGVGATDWDMNLVRFGHFGLFNSSTPGISKPVSSPPSSIPALVTVPTVQPEKRRARDEVNKVNIVDGT
ncbi:hypothetical protein B0H10DRAFT_1955381 [Mycena sp. CBHHK59/15]|nr:hypothetical protein B0H10DRAFT_1955381 [Mycena sp. CBHHK59/15]